MKKIFLIIILLISGLSFGQTNKQFIQSLLTTELSTQEIRDLDLFVRSQPEVEVCRIDIPTKRIFVLSKHDENISLSKFTSWINAKQASFSCFYTGVYGLDEIRKYPFENCDQ